MSTIRGLTVAVLVACSCAPQPVDRVDVDGSLTLGGDTRGVDRPDGGNDGAGTVGTAGRPAPDAGGGGAGGSIDAPVDRLVDRPADANPADAPAPPDAAADLAPPADLAPEVGDTAPEAALPKVVQLVVGDTGALGPGDTAVRTLLATHLLGYSIRLRDDSGAVDLVNTHLIVIAGSVASGMVANKYRTVPVPVISLEYSLFDNLAMVGGEEDTDYGGGDAEQIEIVDSTHPLAAGLTGLVSVVTAESNLAWGNPAATAIRIANVAGEPDRAAIFAYPKGAQMTALLAPAKRVGFFAVETAAARLSDDGIRLLAAAIDWSLLPD